MKNVTQTLKTTVLALILSVGISYVSAWTAPTATPPGGNTSAPLNVGSATQTKSGQFNVATSPISSDTQLGSFSAPGSTAGVGYTSFGGGFVGWDYANGGIALNAHGSGGSVGGIFVKSASAGSSNVGIGTVSPGERLDVAGNIKVSGSINGMQTHGPYSGSTAGSYYHLGSWAGNGWGPDVLVERARYADTSSNASYATNAGNASYATNAGYAATAGNAGSVPCNWNGTKTVSLTNPGGECCILRYTCDGTKITSIYQ